MGGSAGELAKQHIGRGRPLGEAGGESGGFRRERLVADPLLPLAPLIAQSAGKAIRTSV